MRQANSACRIPHFSQGQPTECGAELSPPAVRSGSADEGQKFIRWCELELVATMLGIATMAAELAALNMQRAASGIVYGDSKCADYSPVRHFSLAFAAERLPLDCMKVEAELE